MARPTTTGPAAVAAGASSGAADAAAAAVTQGRRNPPPPPPVLLCGVGESQHQQMKQHEAAAEAAAACPFLASQWSRATGGTIGAAAPGTYVTNILAAAADAAVCREGVIDLLGDPEIRCRPSIKHSSSSSSRSSNKDSNIDKRGVLGDPEISRRPSSNLSSSSSSRSSSKESNIDKRTEWTRRQVGMHLVRFGAFAAGAFVGLLLLLLERQQQEEELQQNLHYVGQQELLQQLHHRGDSCMIGRSVARGFWVVVFAGVMVHKQPDSSSNSTSNNSSSSSRSLTVDMCYQCIALSVAGCCLMFFSLLLLQCRLSCAAAAEALFILLLLLHHSTEYLFVLSFHPQDLSFDSFLLNNSQVYAAVLLLALLEQQLKPSVAAAVLNSSNALLLQLLLQQQVHLPQLVLQLLTFAWHVLLQRPLLPSDLDVLLLPLQRQQQIVPSSPATTASAGAAGAFEPPSEVYWQLYIMCMLVLISASGLVAAIGGLMLRCLGFLTLRENFTHQIRRKKTEKHRLCVHGVYSKCRHPAYAGWFWWAVGSQIVLLNVICCCLFSVVSFVFFLERISFEEKQLIKLFGRDYEVYRHRVRTIGIPGLQSALDAAEKAQRRSS
ncbi:isoprenylcysteine carboxylmethyltransferase, putative [Eimeria maxima]|uniref:Protein-S-isoprenylcysteine O-methyltransferase n=1 Tax=Eimeria maxima TaxID=5804 RepID=U6M7Y3_EIMMA|nr:isoprenylcysteine carboxylmethyltransferase, putative [Eimeria maxima]CDJ60332.1 isoprenylcysteine carboxylmethyltransferase, putative [Eimeria maxima]